MINTVRFAAACLLAVSPFAAGFAAEPTPTPGAASPGIEHAPGTAVSTTAAEVAALRREKETLAAELAAARQTAATLQANLAAATTAQAENDTALKESTRELALLRAKVARLDQPAAGAGATEAAKEKARADEATARLNTLTPALDNTLQEKKALEAKLAEAQHRVTTLQADNDLLKAAAADQVRLAAELEKVRQEKTAAAAKPSPDLSAKLAETEEKLSAAVRSFSLLQTENDRLKAAAATHDALAAELEKARLENAGLQARLAAPPAPAPADNASDLSANLADTEAKLATVLRSFSQLQTENDRLKEEAAGAAEKSRSLSAQAAGDSAARIAALFDELRQANARAAALAGENSRLKTRLALTGPPPGSTLAAPVRPGPAPAVAPGDPTAAPAPAANEPAAAPRTHVIVAGDTLAKIARQAYGNANRWDEILRANRDVLKNENVLPIGATLRIP